MKLLGLATHLYNRPLLLTHDRAAELESVYRAHSEGLAALLSPRPEPHQHLELAAASMQQADAGYYRTGDGIALIPIIGTLVQRGDWMDSASGLIGYDTISGMLQAAVADPRVNAILLEIDSPGGEAPGIIGISGKISAAAAQKPVYALANEQAFSAAYWLATSASKVFVPSTGMVGSVGVVMLHVDQSAKDAKQGLVYTPIFAGDRKVDFSSHAPLSEDAQAVAQDEVDRLYEMFVQAVADGRGIDPQAVRDTQAGLLSPGAALDAGFIDGVQSFDETLAALSDAATQFRNRGVRVSAIADRRFTPTASADDERNDDMATDTKPSLTAEELAQAQTRGFQEGKKEGDAATAKAVADAQAAAGKIAQDRVLAILGHQEAEGRMALARKLAAGSISIEDAVDIMKTAAKEAPAKPTNALAEAMARVDNPKVGLDSGTDAEAQDKALIAKVVSAHNGAYGRNFKAEK